MDHRVTKGLYSLQGFSSTEQVLYWLSWLSRYYKESGRHRGHLRRDVLRFAAEQGLLSNYSFGDQAVFFGYRLCILTRDRAMGCGNDNDPAREDPQRYESGQISDEQRAACIGRRALRDRDLPHIQWRPFAPVSRPRAWSRDELAAARARGLPYH